MSLAQMAMPILRGWTPSEFESESSQLCVSFRWYYLTLRPQTKKVVYYEFIALTTVLCVYSFMIKKTMNGKWNLLVGFVLVILLHLPFLWLFLSLQFTWKITN